MGDADRIVSMIRLVVVQAVVGFQYEGRAIRPGDLVSMRPLDAAVAHRHGLVSLTRPRGHSTTRVPVPSPAAAASTPRRRYRRRDLEPDDA